MHLSFVLIVAHAPLNYPTRLLCSENSRNKVWFIATLSAASYSHFPADITQDVTLLQKECAKTSAV